VKLFLLLLASVAPAPAGAQTLINGAGATFPYPLYSHWFDTYARTDSTVRFNYQPIGSGGGIRQILAGTVDFGATDVPMTDEQLRRAPGIVHVPTVVGAVAATYNVPGISDLRLSPEVLAEIFLGRVTRWNDARLASTNAGARLPDRPIVVVHRSDGSGSTYLWVDLLARASPDWARTVGRGPAVRWPVGLGAKGNEGVAGQVRNMPGALGYVELTYAIANGLRVAAIRNQAGAFVMPTVESAAAAAAAGSVPPDLRISLADPPGDLAYPVAGYTWLLLPPNPRDPLKGAALVRFVKWAIHDGQRDAPKLHYAPLPAAVVRAVADRLERPLLAGR